MNNLSRIDFLDSTALKFEAANSRFDVETRERREQQHQSIIQTPAGWHLFTFAGRFSEISSNSAGANLTLVFRLVLEVQRQGEPVAWMMTHASIFFPPDAADAGVDLEALVVIRVAESIAAARTAEHLLRSGGFGLVVLDLGAKARLPQHAQSRLAGQARRHDTALLCITEKEYDQPSLGSLVSLRAHTERVTQNGNRFRCMARAIKDKRRGPGWLHMEVCHGPHGLH
jgi:recombination protein RecA